MYRIEVFDQSMNYVSACYTDDAQSISLDYLAFDPFQITIQPVEAQKGYFCHITKENVTVADCIISDVKPGKETQQISLRPLQALFDADVYYSPISDAITWLAQTLDDQYVTTSDTAQRRPLNISFTPGGRLFPLTGYNFGATINILSVITTAFRTWGVVTEASLDLVNKQIKINIFEQTATKVIECDLENIISSEVTLGDSYGSTNKITIKKTLADGTDPNVSIIYYRHNDGTIDTTDSDRIIPVFWQVTTLEQTEDMTDADWIAETATMAQEALTPAKYDNEVVIAVWEDDMIVRPKEIALGTITELHIKGIEYYSILTGEEIEGNVYTLTFGAVRTELTKKLSMQSRTYSSSGTYSGGGGGGGGGGESSVLYFYNRAVTTASNAEILRITNAGINADTVVLECTFANPSAISGTVSWTSYSGYISFTGTCTTATTANITLGGAEGGITPPGTELFPVGSVVCESTNTNPSVYYGGTWELIDKQFKYKQWLTADVSDILTLESGTTVSTMCVSLREHCISIERMSVQSTSAISESTITLGTFKFASLGVVGGAMNTNKYFLGQSDGGNGIAFLAITTSGIFETLDRVTTTSGGTIAAGNNINFAFDIQLRQTEMLDSFCDQFYFKRTT